MKNTYRLLGSVLAVSFAALCSCQREDAAPEGEDGRIVLRSGGAAGALNEGDRLGFYCVRSTGNPVADILGERYHDNRMLTVRKGTLSSEVPLFFPDAYTGPSDFYVYYPYSEPGLASGKAQIEITTYENQSSDENFALSDCKLARAYGIPRRPGTTQLVFERLTSRLDFVIFPGEGYATVDALLDAAVTVRNVCRVGNVDYATGTVSSPAIAGDITAHGTFAPNGSGGAEGVSAIVFPQPVAAGTELFFIEAAGKKFRGVLASGQTFEPGKRYTYTLTLNRASTGERILVEATVNDWTEGTPGEGGTVEVDPGTDLDYVTDVEGNEYGTVTIGNQMWTASNLRTTRFNDGSAIANIEDQTQWENCENTEGPAWCYFRNDPENGPRMGVLYNWYAVGKGGLCPAGWRVPTLDDWKELESCLGSEAGKRLKAVSGWYDGYGDTSPSYQGTDEFGFNAVFAGNRRSSKGFGGEGYGEWWSATVASSSTYSASIAYVYAEGNALKLGSTRFKESGQAVRCVKDKAEQK